MEKWSRKTEQCHRWKPPARGCTEKHSKKWAERPFSEMQEINQF